MRPPLPGSINSAGQMRSIKKSLIVLFAVLESSKFFELHLPVRILAVKPNKGFKNDFRHNYSPSLKKGSKTSVRSSQKPRTLNLNLS
jgi:hypothetical protein